MWFLLNMNMLKSSLFIEFVVHLTPKGGLHCEREDSLACERFDTRLWKIIDNKSTKMWRKKLLKFSS